MTPIAAWDRGSRPPARTEASNDPALREEYGAECALVFEDVYSANRKRISVVCRRYLSDPRDVEEAVQDAFMRVYLALPRFCNPDELAAWLTRVAVNRSIDILRQNTRRRDAVLESEATALTPVPGIDEEVTTATSVVRALRSLPQQQALALELRVLHGASHVEVGHAVGRTPVQVKALLYRARQSFKRVWAA